MKDNGSDMTGQHYGTPAYAAPELPSNHHTHKVDIFSFGMM
jgi:hypothetical protein